MSREILDRVWSASGVRLIGDGVPAGDVMTAQALARRQVYAVCASLTALRLEA
jgi:hypothetical protein